MCGFNQETMQNVATGGNIIGTLAQMKAARDQANYQAAIANQNANLAEQQMVSVGQQASSEQGNIRQRARQLAGTQKAGFAANGLDISAGTPLAILGDTARESEQDVQTSRYNSALQMWGLQNQANQYRSAASAYRQAGENEATTSLLTGLTTAAKQYAGLNNNLTYMQKQNGTINNNYNYPGLSVNTDFMPQYGKNSYKNGFKKFSW